MKRRITVALDDEPDSSLSIRQLQSELGDEVSARVLEGLLGSEDILLDNGSNNDDNREEVGSINADDNSEEAEGSDSDDSSEDGEGIESDDSSEDGDDSDSDDSSDEGESSDDDEEEEEDEDEEEDEEEQEQEDEREEEDDNEAGGDSGLGIQPSPTRIVSGFITLVPGFQPTTIDDDTPPSPTSPVRPPESETPELPLVPIPPKPTTSVEIPAPQLTFSPAPPDKTTTSIADNVYQPTETPGRPVQTEETQPGSLDPLTGELRSGDSGMSNGAAVGITLGVLSK
jgi:hypothetical protein